jgi:cytochrome c biogenesis protein CcmG/thiol:disulfide interchange protein DsbE
MAPLEEKQPAPEAIAGPPKQAAWRRLLPVLALVAAVWSGVIWLGKAEDQAQLLHGQAPLLQLQAFAGAPISLASLRGRGVVVNFWASWCEPCRVEADLLEQAARAEKDRGITFVGVNTQDTLEPAKAYLQEFGVSYPNGLDSDGTWRQRFGVNGLPTTFFIDSQGQIQSVVLGPLTSADELARQLDKIRP